MLARLTIAACLVAFALTPVGAAQAAAGAKDCGSASYGSSAPLSSTHYGVGAIKAWKTRCSKARKIALASEGHGGETYTDNGYRCRPGAPKAGKRPYVCTKINWSQDSPRPKVKFRTWGNG